MPTAELTKTAPRHTFDAQALEAIRRRREGVTPGEWVVEHGRIFAGTGPDATQIASMSGSRPWAHDADFIAGAPQDVTYLLSVIDSLLELDASSATIAAHTQAVRDARAAADAPLTDAPTSIRSLLGRDPQ